MKATIFGVVSLLPLMLGVHPMPAQAGMTAHLCGGGTITIPLPKSGRDMPPAPCDMKGCHAGCQRKRFDRAQ